MIEEYEVHIHELLYMAWTEYLGFELFLAIKWCKIACCYIIISDLNKYPLNSLNIPLIIVL